MIRLRFFPVVLVGLAALLVSAAPLHANDDRMVGAVPVSKPRDTAPAEPAKPVPPRNEESRTTQPKKSAPTKDAAKAPEKPKSTPKPAQKQTPEQDAKAAPEPATATAAPVVNTPQPRTGVTMPVRDMESLGPLTNPLKGSLGNDMWDGTARSVLQNYIPQIPDGTTYRSLQVLARRVLLSNGDIGMLSNDRSSPAGEDLFTLRLEKLLAIGAYQDAVDLYTMIEGEPSHDRLARAGIMALMQGGYPAQACLEVRAAHRDKAAQPDAAQFWAQMDAICTFIQAHALQSVRDRSFVKIGMKGLDKSAITGVPGSKVLTTLSARPDYRFAVDTADDIESLQPIERAVLRALGRFDYARFKPKKTAQIPAPILMTIATDPNMPESSRLALNVEATRRGLLDPDHLGQFYLDLAGENEGAPGLPGRYYAYTKAENDRARANITAPLLDAAGSSLITALLPFATAVPDINPAGLSKRSIETGLELMLQAGMIPPARWVTAWLAGESTDSDKNREKVILYLANLLPENLPTESVPFPDKAIQPLFESPESAEAVEIWSLFSGLGRADALHNVANDAVYEKFIDLTVTNDYVMPVDGLIEKIRDAAQNGHIGETALLASVALKDYQTGKHHPAVLKEVLKSLETVGLKEEARYLALGVVLSLKQ